MDAKALPAISERGLRRQQQHRRHAGRRAGVLGAKRRKRGFGSFRQFSLLAGVVNNSGNFFELSAYVMFASQLGIGAFVCTKIVQGLVFVLSRMYVGLSAMCMSGHFSKCSHFHW
jgi:hypothetical protein